MTTVMVGTGQDFTTSDTTPPTLTVTERVAGLSKYATDVISGTVSDTGSGVAKVEVYDTTGGRTVDLGAATLSGIGWSFAASALANGTHAFTAIATDKSGNSTTAKSAGTALTVDMAAPTLTVAQSVSKTTTSTSNTLSGTVADAGSGVAAVEIFINSAGRTIDLGSATLTGGNWSYTASNLTPGIYTFYAVAFDKAGNTTAPIATGAAETVVTPAKAPIVSGSGISNSTASTGPALIVDTTAPTLTVAQSVSGTTISTSNTLSGTVADAGSGVAAVEIFINSAGRTIDLGSATLTGGNWSYTASNLTPGIYTFYAVAFDKAGNTTAPIATGAAETVVTPAKAPIVSGSGISNSTASTGPALIVDTTAPTLTVAQSVSGTTTSTSNTLSGTVADAGSGVAAVEIFINSAGRTIDLGSATLTGGNWSYTASNLTPGIYTFYAVAFDKAGNTTAPIATGLADTVVAATKVLNSTVAAAVFTGSIGINTHLDEYWTSYDTTATVIGDLQYLGVSKVRDSMAAPGDAKLFQTVAAATGVRFDVYQSLSGFSYDAQIAEMKSASGILISVEGINEGDSSLSSMSYSGQTGYAAIAAAQTALYAAIKSDPTTSGLAVIAPSYGNSTHFVLATNTAAVSTNGNAHEYFGTGNPPGGGISTFLTQSALVSGNEPVVATEAGYYTGGSLSGGVAAYQNSGVSETVQAKYNLTLLFDNWKAGIQTTYLYEMLDQVSDPGNTNSEYHFGLFHADGTPKLAATAIHNLMATLADNGTARTDTFGYQIAGAPSTANSLLLEKSTGTFDLAIWNDIRLSDAVTGAELTNPAVPVTIAFGQYVQFVREYDPLTGTSALLTWSNVASVSLNLPDHPVIFEITPYAASQFTLQSFVTSETVVSKQSSGNLWNTLVANAADNNLNALTSVRITAVGTSGTAGSVSFNAATQSLIYTAPTYSPLAPTDSFTYTLADALGDTVTGTVAITETPTPNTLYGTVAGARLNAPGTGWTLVSLAAGEQLYSTFSGVTFVGGADTVMYGGAGSTFTAGDGNHIIGAGANAQVTLGNGNNTIGLTGASNVIVTGNGNNLLWKSIGDTNITMGNGNQTITAAGQNNTISVGVGNSTISVGADGGIAGNESVTVGGGTNIISAGGAGDTIMVKGGIGNQVVATGSTANIMIQAGSNNVVAQGANSVVTVLSGNNNIGTNGDSDTISLGNGTDILWASGNANRITAGSGTASMTFIGQHATIDLTHGTNTLFAQGSSATLILAAPGGTAAQIFGNVMAAGDNFDLRHALAATNWDGRQSTLNNYLSVSDVGNTSVIAIDADGIGTGPAFAIAVLNNVAHLTYASLLGQTTVPAWA